MRRNFIILILLFIVVSVNAQQNALQEALTLYENFEEEKADSLLSKIDKQKLTLTEKVWYWFIYDQTNGTNESYLFYKELPKERFNTLQSADKAMLLSNIAANFFIEWNVESAYEYVQKSMEYAIPLEKSKTVYDFLPHSIMAFAEFGVEKYAAAAQRGFDIYSNMEDENLPCVQSKSIINNALGLATGEFIYKDISIKVQEENLACLLHRKPVHYGSLASTYNNLGQTHIIFGYFQKAMEYQTKAKDVFENHLNGQYYYGWYWHMGWLNYELGNYDLFETYTQMASEMIYNGMGADHFDNVLINRVFVEGYLRFGNLDKAQYYLNKSNSFFMDYYPNGFNETHALIQSQYGEIYFRKKQFDLALHYFLESEKMLKEANEDINDSQYYNYIYIAECHYQLGNYEKVKTYLQALKKMLQPLPKDLWRVQNLKNRARILEIKINDKTNRASAFQQLLNEIKNQDFQQDMAVKTWYELAKHYFDEKKYNSANNTLEEAFDFVQKNVDVLIDKSRIPSSTINELNDLGLKITYHLQLEDASYKNQFFAYQEMKRAYALKKIMAQKQLQSMAFIPDSVLQKENLLKNKIAAFKNQLKTAPYGVRSEIQEALAKNQNQLKELNQRIQNQYPEYFKLYNPVLYDLEKVQTDLPKNTSVVSITSVGDEFYVLLINKDAQEIFKIENQEVSNRIQQLNSELKNNDVTTFKKRAYALYQDLFEPLTSFQLNKKIIWIPDAELNYLNPEILISSSNGSAYKDLDYLITQYEFSRASSVFLAMEQPQSTGKENKKAGFAPVFDKEVKDTYKISSVEVDSSYMQLLQQPFTAQTVNKLAETEKFKPFIRSDATESNFKTQSQNYGIVHLATHTELNPVNPMNSKVYFAKNPKDTLNDGELYIYEIYAQKFENDLAFLSACETAKGFRNEGDEFVSLGHSFNYAGVKNLIFTLWNVDEKTSQEISYDFYRQLGNSKDYAQVLHQAKLDYIQNASPKLASPYYWGGMVIQSGISRPEDNNNRFIYGLIAGIVLLLGIVFLRKRFR